MGDAVVGDELPKEQYDSDTKSDPLLKELNNIPMSTTWVFVGLLCGRELALNTGLTKKGNLKSIFPIVAKDFLKLIVGLLVSVSIVLAIHYGTDQDGDGTLETPPIEVPTQELAPVE